MHELERYRLSNNLTIEELANMLDYDKGNLSKILNGNLGVSKAFQEKVFDKTGIRLLTTMEQRKSRSNRTDSLSNREQELIKELQRKDETIEMLRSQLSTLTELAEERKIMLESLRNERDKSKEVGRGFIADI